jgi:hypothetical protein
MIHRLAREARGGSNPDSELAQRHTLLHFALNIVHVLCQIGSKVGAGHRHHGVHPSLGIPIDVNIQILFLDFCSVSSLLVLFAHSTPSPTSAKRESRKSSRRVRHVVSIVCILQQAFIRFFRHGAGLSVPPSWGGAVCATIMGRSCLCHHHGAGLSVPPSWGGAVPPSWGGAVPPSWGGAVPPSWG